MMKARAGNWARRSLCLTGLAALTLSIAQPASAAAADCPGNPDALGTSRTIVVDPTEHPKIGTMQYSETLPLQDHEVVLTFDDGPIPKHSNQILAILAAECVKATFFEVGRMATEYPEGVRKLIAAGHSVGTHTQNHPLTMNRMPIEQAQKEIDDGIASTTAALGDPAQLSPFMRIPGLLRASAVEDYLASKGIQTWSADFPADDWRHVSPQKVHDLAISRIAAKGKGILLLHDIQQRTVTALPSILRDLKAGGYRIVHVEAAMPGRPKTPTEPQQWQMHPISETVALSHWPKVPRFAYAHTDLLAVPTFAAADQLRSLTSNFDRSRRARGAAAPNDVPWPRDLVQAVTVKFSLPVPSQDLFEISEKHSRPIRALVELPHHAERTPVPGGPSGAATRIVSTAPGAVRQIIPGAIPPGLNPTRQAVR
jgi:peptidoglycan/xylan/chitin deacetylase (PgdA/CDA1 family)